MGKLASSKFVGTVALLSHIALSCTGEEFRTGDADAGITNGNISGATEIPSNPEQTVDDPDNNPALLDECVQKVCDIPECPPQLQETPQGECCPLCPVPQACEQGARCDALDCPGATTEVTDGCCVCENVQCDEGAQACSDPQCVGAQQEVVGGGCCICGDQLECEANQKPCDTILCDTPTIYIADGCCECEQDTSCGAGSTECSELTCDSATQSKHEVGGGCCVCETLPTCENGSVECATIQCASAILDLGDGCCECEAGPPQTCDADSGELTCTQAECNGDVLQLPNGCCRCEESPQGCQAGQAECSTLSCPDASPIEVATECCICGEPECPNDSSPCTTLDCQGSVESVTETCCRCVPDAETCNEDLQAAYTEQRNEFIDYFMLQACEEDADCELVDVANACRAECNTPLRVGGADDFAEGMERWASEHCAACARANVQCPEPTGSVACIAGQCGLVAADEPNQSPPSDNASP